MTLIEQPEDAESDDEEAGTDLYLALPFDEHDQQREGQDHEQHREQMAASKRSERRNERAWAPFHQASRNGQRPPHPRV